MKIISCHVENFGTLSGRDFAFHDGLNTVLDENGKGKSTLAGFIKAMFYGLPKTAPRSVAENERKRFNPWQGGSFGGSLVFEYRGREYRVTRKFGITARGDKCKIYFEDTGEECAEFEGELGERLFSIDPQAFERSIFHPQRPTPTGENASVAAKLGELDDDGEDMRAYSSAVAQLERKRLALDNKSGTVYRGRVELLTVRKSIADCESRLRRLDSLKDEIRSTDMEIGELLIRHEKARNDMRDAARLGELRQKKLARDRIKSAIDEATDGIKLIDGSFPKGLPDEASLTELSQRLTEADRLTTLAAGYDVNERDAAREEELSRYFGDIKRTSAKLSDMTSLVGRINAFDAPGGDGERLKSAETRVDSIEASHPDGVAPFTDIASVIAKNRRLTELSEKESRHESYSRDKKKRQLIILIGALTLALGAGLSFALLPLGLGLIALGAAVTVTGALLFIRGERDAAEPVDREEIERLKNDVDVFVERWGIDASRDAMGALEKERDVSFEYESEKRRRESLLPARERRAEAARALEEELRSFGVIDVSDHRRALDGVSGLAYEYRALMDSNAVKTKRALENRRKADALYSAIDRELAGCGTGGRADVIASLFNAVREREKACAALAGANAELDDFMRDSDAGLLDGLPDGDPGQLAKERLESALAGELTALKEARAAKLNEAENLSLAQDELDALRVREEELRQKTDEEQQTLDAVKLAIEQLSKAKDEIASGYVALMREGLKKYAALVEGDKGHELAIDKAFNVTSVTRGDVRPYDSFSRGERDIFDLCTRLALSDALYRGDSMFMILDDPFANLDDENLRRARSLLDRLAEERQIIYLVCHSSRK